MQTILKEKLQAYIIEDHPEMMSQLRVNCSLNRFLEDKVGSVMPLVLNLLEEEKPGYAIVELAMNNLRAQLGPSRFQYIRAIIETEFPEDYSRFARAGVLTFETINLLEQCKSVFEAFGFTEAKKSNGFLRQSIITKLQGHFEKEENSYG